MGRSHPGGEDQGRLVVAGLIERARAAQARYERYSQANVDEVVSAAGWAVVKPENNRRLAELAVADTGLGNVPDKIAKNERKTMGLLRDLQGAKSVGVIAEYPELGIVEIARAAGVVAALTPSTNPGATPANKILNALKGRNAVIVAPSPKGWSTCALLLEFIHSELAKVGAPADLVQMLPAPVTKEATQELMRSADLVVATGSQANVRAAYSSGTPALGVGLGNVAVIIDDSADAADAARKIQESKCFDNATSCSSENSLVIHERIYRPMLSELQKAGGMLLDASEKAKLQAAMWRDGKLSAEVMARPVEDILKRAGLAPRAVKVHRLPESGQFIELRLDRLQQPAIEEIAQRLCRFTSQPRSRRPSTSCAASTPTRAQVTRSASIRRTMPTSCAWGSRCRRRASSSTRRTPSPTAAPTTTGSPSRCLWAAAPGAATRSPRT